MPLWSLNLSLLLLPRQSVGGGKSIQKRVLTRSPLVKTTALRGKLTFGDPFEDSGVVLMAGAEQGRTSRDLLGKRASSEDSGITPQAIPAES
jgi:hypothetical protein